METSNGLRKLDFKSLVLGGSIVLNIILVIILIVLLGQYEQVLNIVDEDTYEVSDATNLLDDGESVVSSQNEISEEEIYIKESLSLDSAKVSMCEGYLGSDVGLSQVSIKNNGDKNVEEMVVTVYFQDENGENIAEASFMVIGGYMGGDTLKANYSWKLEDDKYYAIDNLASEVNITKYYVEISDITFAEN